MKDYSVLKSSYSNTSLKSVIKLALFLYFKRHHKTNKISYSQGMKNIIQAVMEYYQVNRIEAIRIINLRKACGEYDELIRDLREEEIYV